MENIKELGKKQIDEAKNLVLETKGGEMPDADRKPEETASEAAQAFENNKKEDLTEKVRNQLVVDDDDDEDEDQDTEVEKKAG